MPATTTAPPEDGARTLTTAEANAILVKARNEAEQAARAVDTAERTLRGELDAEAAGMRAEDITPAALAELRQNAEHAELLIPAAERRVAEIQAAGAARARAEALATVLAEADQGLGGAEAIIEALDAFEAAARKLCDSVTDHNDRVQHWYDMMGRAGIRADHGPGDPAVGMTRWPNREDGVQIGAKAYRPMRGGQLLAAVLYRLLEEYPRDFRKYNYGRELADDGDLRDSNGPVNVHALIRRDA